MGVCLKYFVRRYIRVLCPLCVCVIFQHEKESVTNIISQSMNPAGKFPSLRGVVVSDRLSARNCSPVCGDAGVDEPPTLASRVKVQHDHVRYLILESDDK